MTVRATPWPLGAGRFTVPGNRWDLLDTVPLSQPPMVSVIVPYYQAQQQLDRMLIALAAQTHPADRLQVVVADDGSPTPPTIHAPAGLRVDVVTQDDRGFRAAAARNLGVERATGDVLCFLDQDTLPEPDYVRALTRLPALLPDAVVTGRRRHAGLAGLDDRQTAAWLAGHGRTESQVLDEPQWLLAEHRASGDLLRIGPDANRYVISAVLACSRALFDEAGGFDPRFVRYGGEDWEFAHRALCAGAVLAHVPGAVAWHDGPSWADRGDAQSQRHEANAQTATLAGLIPPAYGRADVWTGRPNMVVEIAIDGEDEAAVIVAVRSVLSADVDAAVWLTGTSARPIATEHFAFDPRVNVGVPDAAVLAGARIQVTCSRPSRVAPTAWAALIGRLTPYADGAGVGRLVVDTGDGVLVMTATAAVNRARRWSSRARVDDVLADLFGRTELDAETSGVTAIARVPDLAHELKHLRDG